MDLQGNHLSFLRQAEAHLKGDGYIYHAGTKIYHAVIMEQEGLTSTMRDTDRPFTLYVDYSLCQGCGACAELYPGLFEMREGQAWVINHESFYTEEQDHVVNVCIYGAIYIQGPGTEARSHDAPSSRGRSGRKGR